MSKNTHVNITRPPAPRIRRDVFPQSISIEFLTHAKLSPTADLVCSTASSILQSPAEEGSLAGDDDIACPLTTVTVLDELVKLLVEELACLAASLSTPENNAADVACLRNKHTGIHPGARDVSGR